MLFVYCWSFVVEANGQFRLTQRKIAKQLAAMTHESTHLVLARTHEDMFQQRMKKEGIEPNEKLITEVLEEVRELGRNELRDLASFDQHTGWWGSLLSKTTGKILTLGLRVKFSRAKMKSRIFKKKERPPFSEMSEETFITVMGMAEQQKHHTKALIAQFQQATLDPDAIDYDMLSHENFLRLYLEQLSEQDLEILINHLNTLESSDPKWDTLQL